MHNVGLFVFTVKKKQKKHMTLFNLEIEKQAAF